MRYAEVTAKLKAAGCVEIPRRGGGSHRKWHNPANNTVVPVPDWGSRDLKTGTIRHIVRHLGLDWEQFKQA